VTEENSLIIDHRFTQRVGFSIKVIYIQKRQKIYMYHNCNIKTNTNMSKTEEHMKHESV